MVAFSGFYESHELPPSSDARGILPPHHDHHQNGHQSGYILHYRCVDWRPGGCRGDTERVVARWQRSVVSGEALVVLHWAMRSVLHRRIAMSIEMARNGGTHLFAAAAYFDCCNRS